MASLNKVTIIGHLGKDPESRFLPDGKAVTNFTVATSETWKDKESGEKKEKTEWSRVTAFGKLAEICGEYLRKGALVYVEGKLGTRKWTDKEGVERYTTEITCDTMKMLGGRSDRSEEKPQRSKPASKKNVSDGKPDPFDDGDSIPF